MRKTLATVLSNIPLSREGPAQIVIFDIHALQVSTRVYTYTQFFFCNVRGVLQLYRIRRGMQSKKEKNEINNGLRMLYMTQAFLRSSGALLFRFSRLPKASAYA